MRQQRYIFYFFILLFAFGCSKNDLRDYESRSLSSGDRAELGGSYTLDDFGSGTNVTFKPFKSKGLSPPAPMPRPDDLMDQFYEGLSELYLTEGLPRIGKVFNKKCKKFIEDDGSIGPTGQAFIDAMHEVEAKKGRPIFFGKGADLVQFDACKSTRYFQSLSVKQQEHIYAWFWASTAQAESSCRENITVNGQYDKKMGRYKLADGLMQLEQQTYYRNTAGRDKHFCPDDTNTRAVRFQARCSASILADTQAGRTVVDRSGRGKRYSYWEKFKKSDGIIFRNLRKHPACR